MDAQQGFAAGNRLRVMPETGPGRGLAYLLKESLLTINLSVAEKPKKL